MADETQFDIATILARVKAELRKYPAEVATDLCDADLDDVVQMAALRAIETLDKSRSKPTTWACWKVSWALRRFLDARNGAGLTGSKPQTIVTQYDEAAHHHHDNYPPPGPLRF
jgi:DNA-directed RNA polymerase specialized sigma24 family protein